MYLLIAFLAIPHIFRFVNKIDLRISHLNIPMTIKNTEILFTEAFQENKDKIFRICRSYCDNKEDAEDLFQEVLINIWKSLPSFKEQSSINTWIYRITVNLCLRTRHFSSNKKKIVIHVDGVELENTEEEITEDKNEEFKKLEACVEKLDGINKSIVLLYLEDLSYKKISEITGLSENHVAVKIKRIKNKLLQCLKNKS